MFPYEKGFLDLIMYTLFVSLIDIILKERNRVGELELRILFSFFTAWARTSGDNFWQSRIRHGHFLSALLKSGCSCLSIETHGECVRNKLVN